MPAQAKIRLVGRIEGFGGLVTYPTKMNVSAASRQSTRTVGPSEFGSRRNPKVCKYAHESRSDVAQERYVRNVERSKGMRSEAVHERSGCAQAQRIGAHQKQDDCVSAAVSARLAVKPLRACSRTRCGAYPKSTAHAIKIMPSMRVCLPASLPSG